MAELDTIILNTQNNRIVIGENSIDINDKYKIKTRVEGMYEVLQLEFTNTIDTSHTKDICDKIREYTMHAKKAGSRATSEPDIKIEPYINEKTGKIGIMLSMLTKKYEFSVR